MFGASPLPHPDIIDALVNEGGCICALCAKELGATWPNGHVATHWTAPCSVCHTRQGVCDVYDYNWPDHDVRERREL